MASGALVRHSLNLTRFGTEATKNFLSKRVMEQQYLLSTAKCCRSIDEGRSVYNRLLT